MTFEMFTNIRTKEISIHKAGIAGDSSITDPNFCVWYSPLGRLYNAQVVFYENGFVVSKRLPCGCLDRMVCTYTKLIHRLPNAECRRDYVAVYRRVGGR